MIKRFIKYLLIALPIALTMSGCGGGGGGGTGSATSSTASSTIYGTGYYVDAAVSGIIYECGSEKGTTDENGKFKFRIGESCTFKLGTMVLRTIDSDRLENGVVILETNENIAALLQSLDADGDPDNGIEIKDDVSDAVSALKLQSVPTGDSEIETAVNNINTQSGNHFVPVTIKTAKEHLQRSLSEQLFNENPKKLVVVNEIEENQGSSEAEEKVVTNFEPLDDETFNGLSSDKQLYLAKKLYATIYKGKDRAALAQEINSKKFITEFRNGLNAQPEQTDLDKIIPFDPSLEAHDYQQDRTERYTGNIKEEIVSRLYYTKLGKEYFNEWVAYVLTQTILFSPAREVDSVTPFPEFIRNVYYRLVDRLNENVSVKNIVYEHIISKENWGRFRSPEDNGREMLEIWLYDFDDAKVPTAAVALKNWKFDNYYDPSKGWQVYKFYHDEANQQNEQAVELLGVTMNNGYDFFRAVVNHQNFMHTVVFRIVGYFFPTYSEEAQHVIVQKILSSNPETFQDIFKQIILSKEYLFHSDKVKSIEELYYPLTQELPYHVIKNAWGGVLGALEKANQASMWNKLGRDNQTPTDTLSINYYHQFIRDTLLDQCDNADSQFDAGVLLGAFDAKLDKSSVENYLNDIFTEMLGRKMTSLEKITLTDTVTKAGYAERFQDWPWQRYKTIKMALDYISRLSELYRYENLDEGGVS